MKTKNKLIFLAFPALLYGESLKEIVNIALVNNNIVNAKVYTQESQKYALKASRGNYLPTLSIGGNFQSLNEKTPNVAGDIYSGYVKVSWNIYDAGKTYNNVKQNEALLHSSNLELTAYQKELQKTVVEDFYSIKNAEASLEALNEKQKLLDAELQRVKMFFEVGSTTKDDVEKLQAELSNNLYQIETLKYQILSMEKLLSIKIGKEIQSFEESAIEVPNQITTLKENDTIASLKQQKEALGYSAKSVDDTFEPYITVENTYNSYDYDRDDLNHPAGLDDQNKLMVSLNIKLFDGQVNNNQKKALLMQQKSLHEEIKQLEQIQETNAQLSLAQIETTKAQIQSAKSSLESAQSAYETVLEKYRVGVSDNVAYLDALSVKTQAQALYSQALNNLHVAYAYYYYYTNQEIKDYIK